MSLPAPKDVSELRSFLGLVGYYRAFIPKFASVATPLFALLKKDIEYVWTSDCEKAMSTLKQSLASDPVLSVPCEEGVFVLYTDWSLDAVSAILHQRVNDVEYVIEYGSKTCNVHE